jgi:glucose-6-phosphate 1-dehydrogenase
MASGSGFTASSVVTKDELCLIQQVPLSCGIIIFGASGDLAHRKLFPSLLQLLRDKVMPEQFYVLGLARSPLSDDAFREGIAKSVGNAFPAELVQTFLKRCFYIAGDYGNPATYTNLRSKLTELDDAHKTSGRHLFYLSVPPPLYASIAEQLGLAGLSRTRRSSDNVTVPKSEESWTRLVVEKPFGQNLASAQALNQALHNHFNEDQLYRIDHYLGKETVQNILMFRFANAIFEPVWNHKYIDHVQITAAEEEGVGHRAGYYEQAGVLRDMFQNHLFQLLSLVSMEPPASFAPDAVRDEKSKIMASVTPFRPMDIANRGVRGQYEGYRNEDGVNPNSTTETFAALRVEIDNWRWFGVPFYLRSGKKLARRETEIAIQFKHVPTSIFKPLMADQISPNILRFRIQPDEGISLCFESKHPGPKLCMSTVTMQFNYEDAFGVKPPEAYARLFLDVMVGDPTLFARQDWLASSWALLDPVLDSWAEKKDQGLSHYAPGSWGPAEADAMLHAEGRSWLLT